MKTCPKCNTRNLNDSKNCDSCGAVLDNQKNIKNENWNDTEILKELKKITSKISTLNSVTEANKNISILDIKMSFLSMVIFIIKWAIAAIPAMIILFIIGLVFSR